jgi:pSer/pThr/pTyr-binding forkhead associated (FHA) protein
MHCKWGQNTAKVTRLLRPPVVESAFCRLSPMNTLRTAEKTLNSGSPVMSIGKDKSNDVVIPDMSISRQHCMLELDAERGAVYVIDMSTNGTFLNGLRLPSSSVGKVLLSHGDELLLKNPAAGDGEYGYIVNLIEQVVRQPKKYEAPRRILSAQEASSVGRDFS